MTKKKKKYYLLPEEEDPHREVQNKNSIGKLMFLAIVGKPRKNAQGIQTFSGKVGIFPFVKEVRLLSQLNVSFHFYCQHLFNHVVFISNRSQLQEVVGTAVVILIIADALTKSLVFVAT